MSAAASGGHHGALGRIVIVGPLPPPEGGMANQTRDLARLLSGEGFDVTVVRTNAPYWPTWVGSVRGARAAVRLVPYVWRLFSSTRGAGIVHVMANSGWAWHLVAAPAIWIGRLRRVPVVVHYHGGEAAKFLERRFRWVRRTLAMASAVIVPSGFLALVFSRWHIATEVVPNVIDLARFHSTERERGDGLRFLVARNLEDIYDIPTALAAFALIRQSYPRARLSVAGSGPRLQALQRRCEELGIVGAVTFTGRLDSRQMAELYRDADVLLNPSLADNMPISILEALSSGAAVVSTNVGGIPFLVENEATALLVPPSDPGAMAAAALRLIRDPLLFAALRENGHQLARRYAWPQVRPMLLNVYERVLAHGSAKALGNVA